MKAYESTLVALIPLTIASCMTANAAGSSAIKLQAKLSGAAEVPGPGDPDGRGMAVVMLYPRRGRLCYALTVAGTAPARAAHIHAGAAGTEGPQVVPLEPPAQGTSNGCASVSPGLVRDMSAHPGNYYVNVHNGEYSGGAVRGQLG